MAGAHTGQAVDQVILIPGGDVIKQVFLLEQGPSGVVLVPEGGSPVIAFLDELVELVVGIAHGLAVAVGAKLEQAVVGAVGVGHQRGNVHYIAQGPPNGGPCRFLYICE